MPEVLFFKYAPYAGTNRIRLKSIISAASGTPVYYLFIIALLLEISRKRLI